MKTIEIDQEDEMRLIEILSQNGFGKYVERITTHHLHLSESSKGLAVDGVLWRVPSDDIILNKKMNGADRNNW